MASFSIASIAVAAIGTAVSAAGAASSAAAQRDAANYQAQVARNNAIIANQNAEYATRAGAEKATETGMRNRAAIGAVTTAIAANNIDVNTGSAVDVRTSQRELGELDTEQTVTNAALQAYGYRSQSTNFEAQGGLDAATARSAGVAGAFGAGGSLLSGASSLGAKWAQLQNSGAFSTPSSGSTGGGSSMGFG